MHHPTEKKSVGKQGTTQGKGKGVAQKIRAPYISAGG